MISAPRRISRATILALLAAGAAGAAEPARLSADECQVYARERSFADSVDRHDEKAFIEHLHADAVFNAASPAPQRGRDAVVAGWKDIIEGKALKLTWRPQYVSIGANTNVAMSRGPYTLASMENGQMKYAIGTFVSVWVRKDAASPWYVLLDGGGAAPTAATEQQAKQHLAAAVTHDSSSSSGQNCATGSDR